MKHRNNRQMTIACYVFLSVFIVSFSAFSNEYQDYLKSQREEFQNYKDERDAEFIGFLKEQWKEFKVSSGYIRDEKPKPVKLPVASPTPKPLKLPPNLKVVDKVKVPTVKPVAPVIIAPEKPVEKPVVDKPVPDKPVPVIEKPAVSDKPVDRPTVKPVEPPLVIKPDTKPEITKRPETPKPVARPVAITIEFYSAPIVIYGNYDFPGKYRGAIDNEVVASFWDKMSRIDYDSILTQTAAYRKAMKLNDWAYHYVFYRLGLALYNGNRNMANLFVWYLSSKSGYETRIGYNESQIYLLMPSNTTLFGVPFLTVKGMKYYAVFYDGQPEKFRSLYTYNGNYPDTERVMDYRILQLPEIPRLLKTRDLRFEYNRKNYDVVTSYNKNMVDMFRNYPQTNLKIYFDAYIDPDLEYTLLKSLKPLVEGKSEPEAVNGLLRFVQKSFAYKTDDDQFGHEKYMLADETVFYPYSDCEDRAFFFAYLVKKLVGLDVIGLDYPGHVATAVNFSIDLPGDSVIRNGKKYLVCDPTYINANLGMAMPQFKSVKPEIIKIGL